MHQRSAADQEDSWYDQPAPFATDPGPVRPRPSAHKIAPRLSLPQRAVIGDATLEEEWREEMQQPVRNQKRNNKPASQALSVHTTETSPLTLSDSASPADLQLIPRTSPALPSVTTKQGWFHHYSPRITIIKLSLIALVALSVLGATFATTGGGGVTSFLIRTLSNVIPYSAPAQPASATTVAQRVHPIIQADINAGYDSRQQHDTWWDYACSAAVMTEILHAWGVQDVTIGQLIDVMYAHTPPYITPWGGLMTSNAWDYVMSRYRLHASAQTNRTMSYDTIVRMTQKQGVPVVIGVRDNGGRYYPALSVGHYLIAVGGDAAGLRIVDSSLYRITYLPYDEFNYLWDGKTVAITL